MQLQEQEQEQAGAKTTSNKRSHQKPVKAKRSNEKPLNLKISTQNLFCLFDLDLLDPIDVIFYKCLTFLDVLQKKRGKIAISAFFQAQTSQKFPNLSKKHLFFRNNR